MTNPDTLNRKIAEAAEATKAFIHFLSEEDLQYWAKRFADILEYLDQYDSKGALHLQKTTHFGGMGSLSDVLIERQHEFDRLCGAQSRAMSNLRLYIEYDIDRNLEVKAK